MRASNRFGSRCPLVQKMLWIVTFLMKKKWIITFSYKKVTVHVYFEEKKNLNRYFFARKIYKSLLFPAKKVTNWHCYKGGCEHFRFRNYAKFSWNFLFRVLRNFPIISWNFAKHEIKIWEKFSQFRKTRNQIWGAILIFVLLKKM